MQQGIQFPDFKKNFFFFLLCMENYDPIGPCSKCWQRENFGFPGGSDDKESACNAEDLGQIPGSEEPL